MVLLQSHCTRIARVAVSSTRPQLSLFNPPQIWLALKLHTQKSCASEGVHVSTESQLAVICSEASRRRTTGFQPPTKRLSCKPGILRKQPSMTCTCSLLSFLAAKLCDDQAAGFIATFKATLCAQFSIQVCCKRALFPHTQYLCSTEESLLGDVRTQGKLSVARNSLHMTQNTQQLFQRSHHLAMQAAVLMANLRPALASLQVHLLPNGKCRCATAMNLPQGLDWWTTQINYDRTFTALLWLCLYAED
jgi:hypothetical protein